MENGVEGLPAPTATRADRASRIADAGWVARPTARVEGSPWRDAIPTDLFPRQLHCTARRGGDRVSRSRALACPRGSTWACGRDCSFEVEACRSAPRERLRFFAGVTHTKFGGAGRAPLVRSLRQWVSTTPAKRTTTARS